MGIALPKGRARLLRSKAKKSVNDTAASEWTGLPVDRSGGEGKVGSAEGIGASKCESSLRSDHRCPKESLLCRRETIGKKATSFRKRRRLAGLDGQKARRRFIRVRKTFSIRFDIRASPTFSGAKNRRYRRKIRQKHQNRLRLGKEETTSAIGDRNECPTIDSKGSFRCRKRYPTDVRLKRGKNSRRRGITSPISARSASDSPDLERFRTTRASPSAGKIAFIAGALEALFRDRGTREIAKSESGGKKTPYKSSAVRRIERTKRKQSGPRVRSHRRYRRRLRAIRRFSSDFGRRAYRWRLGKSPS